MQSSLQFVKAIKVHVLSMLYKAQAAHLGSNFSIADLLAVLYTRILNVNPTDPKMPNRDRFLLSKGHATAILYATLAELGFFPKNWLENYYQNGSLLLGHVHSKVPGVEFSTGSLGHALPVAAGMAFAAQKRNQQHRVFTLVSDGELDEGSNWEAMLFAAHHRLNQLYVILDYNKLQLFGRIEDIVRLEPLRQKWEAFGWEVLEVDGHNHDQIEMALKDGFKEHKPHVLIAHTVKGKGVSFMENRFEWHSKILQSAEFESALKELTHA